MLGRVLVNYILYFSELLSILVFLNFFLVPVFLDIFMSDGGRAGASKDYYLFLFFLTFFILVFEEKKGIFLDIFMSVGGRVGASKRRRSG